MSKSSSDASPLASSRHPASGLRRGPIDVRHHGCWQAMNANLDTLALHTWRIRIHAGVVILLATIATQIWPNPGSPGGPRRSLHPLCTALCNVHVSCRTIHTRSSSALRLRTVPNSLLQTTMMIQYLQIEIKYN
ncbi:GL18076 [Drosophila persimilis]|uniref:GL18076 n=1 Tax=Drosophila persimilis TaxID=7234 RepID=B4HDC2_DROPE|nr:GL18076 [Drosophila persimilis]